jgi:hypothetical protein
MKAWLNGGDYSGHASQCLMLSMDIQAQMEHMNKSVGDVKEAYKRIILDKMWRLNKIQGEFYHKCLAETSEAQEGILQINKIGEGRYVMPQFPPEVPILEG